MTRYVTAAELAEALGISVRTLSRRIEAGKVPAPARLGSREWRKWPLDGARAFLGSAGFAVPESWSSERAA